MNRFFHDYLKTGMVPYEKKNITLSFIYFATLLLVECNYGLCYDHFILFPLVVLVAWCSNHLSRLLNFPSE